MTPDGFTPVRFQHASGASLFLTDEGGWRLRVVVSEWPFFLGKNGVWRPWGKDMADTLFADNQIQRACEIAVATLPEQPACIAIVRPVTRFTWLDDPLTGEAVRWAVCDDCGSINVPWYQEPGDMVGPRYALHFVKGNTSHASQESQQAVPEHPGQRPVSGATARDGDERIRYGKRVGGG